MNGYSSAAPRGLQATGPGILRTNSRPNVRKRTVEAVDDLAE
jgi:hypothetical protein